MSFRSFLPLTLRSLVITSLILSLLLVSQAEVRSSTNYQLESDSINFGGGQSTSSNYTLESTAGEIATGPSDSASYKLRAGYQQMHEVFLSLSVASDVVMSPTIGGLTGGTANGSTSVNVLTDSGSGYALTIKAENNPAMQKGADSIADYLAIASPNPDRLFTYSPTEAFFGFSPFGSDVTPRYFNNGSVCNSGGSNSALMCWDGLSTSNQLIASGGANQPNGATTTIYFRVGVGNNKPVTAGDYIATTTLTALPL